MLLSVPKALATVLAVLPLHLVQAQESYPSSSATPSSSSSTSLPTVDLGYNLHRALTFNETGRYYNFSNIRYAAPVTGDNRWRAPKAPETNRSSVQTGAENRICPQATPSWIEDITPSFILQYLGQGKTNFTPSDFPMASNSTPKDAPGTNEDCLFLDVMVPEKIFNSAGKGYGAPVLVWIYGGGYTEGSKSGSGNPAGLLERAMADNVNGVIYVAMNYRLGAFGWQSGPTFQEDGTANAGLYDQRFALEWVQQYIHLFGGDRNRVTVFGESAGGGSIMHQITAWGGTKGKSPFQQAIPQSPGWLPVPSNNQEEQYFNQYLQLLNVSSLDEARKLPYETLQKANVAQVAAAPTGAFVYGPTVDGDFVPKLPGQLLLHGQFDKSVNVMVGHNADEGLLFTSPFLSNNTALDQQLLTTLPTLKAFPDILNEIANVLYPPIFDGSQAMGYTNQIGRAAALISELVFVCNTYYLDKAFGNNTHSYLFSVFPALHGFDIPYTYYNGPANTSAKGQADNVTIALALQDYITNFATTGNPNDVNTVPFFNMYGMNATVQDLNVTGIRGVRDPAANARCDFWQKALYA